MHFTSYCPMWCQSAAVQQEHEHEQEFCCTPLARPMFMCLTRNFPKPWMLLLHGSFLWLSKAGLEHELSAGCLLQAGTIRRGDQTFRCNGATCHCGLCHRKCCSRLLLPHGGPLQHPGVLLSETPSLVKAVHHILMGLGCNVRQVLPASKMREACLSG